MSGTITVAVVSSNETVWGGSEELWKHTAVELARRGHDVSVMKPWLLRRLAPLGILDEVGCELFDLARPFKLPGIVFRLLAVLSPFLAHFWLTVGLYLALLRVRPQVVLLSQGVNWDGARYGGILRRLGLPYVILSQKGSELYWPRDSEREEICRFYRAAAAACFVSQHNLELTELQLGEAIPSARVVRNPFLVSFHDPAPWPEDQAIVDFACVGRLYAMEKGQDLLLRVLGSDKWRDRPVAVTFYGEGINRHGLEAMARHLELTNVSFAGQVPDVEAIWRRHQALVLPSRAEGLPLVVVEAMLAGRVAIVTDCGGSAELLENGETGFVALAPTVAALDDALESAWRERARWREIGASAAAHIRTQVSPHPERELTELLCKVVNHGSAASLNISKRPSLAQ